VGNALLQPSSWRAALLLGVCGAGLVCGSSAAAQGLSEQNLAGRSALIYVPSQLPAPGARALVIVLHGGLGNARRIVAGQSETGMNMDAEAEKNQFVVAYLNGTPATRRLGLEALGWNAGGGCCGQPADNDVDDVGYIKRAVEILAGQYAIDPARIYGLGHSNGAMMTQRVLCETGLYAAAVAISGPLNVAGANCAAARGTRVLAIHGAQDANVPMEGGRGTQGLSRAVYNSEEHSRRTLVDSGASYDLLVLQGADHSLDHIEAALEAREHLSIAQKAERFFGLASPGR
jgi:polyhydroxybutyrate depolymerase